MTPAAKGLYNISQLSGRWPGVWMATRLEVILVWYIQMYLVNIRTTWFTQQKQRSVWNQGHLQPRLPFKGQVTEQTTVKWSFSCNKYSNLIVPVMTLDSRYTQKRGEAAFGLRKICYSQTNLLHFMSKNLLLSNKFATFYVTSRLHEKFLTTWICKIKANAPAFQQICLSPKNWPIFPTYTSK